MHSSRPCCLPPLPLLCAGQAVLLELHGVQKQSETTRACDSCGVQPRRFVGFALLQPHPADGPLLQRVFGTVPGALPVARAVHARTLTGRAVFEISPTEKLPEVQRTVHSHHLIWVRGSPDYLPGVMPGTRSPVQVRNIACHGGRYLKSGREISLTTCKRPGYGRC